MKKNIIFIIIGCIISQLGMSQIGVNTDNPKTLLHIDSKSSAATTNPATGAVSALQASDDVVVTSDGRIGIGTLTPSAKIDILSSTPGALRIIDGSERSFRMLVSDNNGVLSWTSAMGTWFASMNGKFPLIYETTYIMKPIKGYSESVISSPTEGAVNVSTGEITVPYKGYYRVTIGGHWGTNRTGANVYVIIPYVYINGAPSANFIAVGAHSNYGLSPTFITVLPFNANDKVMVYNDQRWGTSANVVDQIFFDIEYIE